MVVKKDAEIGRAAKETVRRIRPYSTNVLH